MESEKIIIIIKIIIYIYTKYNICKSKRKAGVGDRFVCTYIFSLVEENETKVKVR